MAKWNQLVSKITRDAVTSGSVTIQRNSDDVSITITGGPNSSNFSGFGLSTISTQANHKYLATMTNKNIDFTNDLNWVVGNNMIIQPNANRNIAYSIWISAGQIYNDRSYFMIFDLTDIFGAGNEPTTYEAARAAILTETGRDIDEYHNYDAGSTIARRARLVSESGATIKCSALVLPKLPREYQEVEWIQSAGTEWIDTGVKGNQDTRLVADYQLTSLAQPKRFFGCRDNNMFYIAYETNLFFGYDIHIIQSTANTDLNRHIIDFNQNNVYVDDVNVYTFIKTSFTTTENLALCSAYYNGTYNNGTLAKHYNYKIYQGSTLVRNFVPCYRKSDSVIGLYDLVSGTFFTNSGTGTFTKGPDVI